MNLHRTAQLTVSYLRAGGSDDYAEAVDDVLDLLTNALTADGWDFAEGSGGVRFVRHTEETGDERLVLGVYPVRAGAEPRPDAATEEAAPATEPAGVEPAGARIVALFAAA